jgi:hypothetical protein
VVFNLKFLFYYVQALRDKNKQETRERERERERERNERNDNATYCKTWPRNYFFKNAKVAFSICDGNILYNL